MINLSQQLHERLFELSPRGFELFAGDLLVYLGVRNVQITRYASDGGIDATGAVGSESGLIDVPTGVQVKRQRQNVQRPEIDRFIGTLLGSFHHGIFISTSGFASSAQAKARTTPLHIALLDGPQIGQLMAQQRLGLVAATDRIDEDYFASFEQQAGRGVREASEAYYMADEVPSAATDLISLRALSYALHVDQQTVQRAVERGAVRPDTRGGTAASWFFRRDRVASIRAELGLAPTPASGEAWRTALLDFSQSRQLTKSYKPVLLLALLEVVDADGSAPLSAVAQRFQLFYQQRAAAGLPIEAGASLELATAPLSAITALIVKFPLERFKIQGLLELDLATSIVRFNPALWEALRFSDTLLLRQHARQQLEHYYARIR